MGTQANEFARIRGRDEGGMSRDEVSASDTRIGMMSDLKYKFGHVYNEVRVGYTR